MKGQLPNPVQEVYSSDGWTQWNPLISTENRPVDISSVIKWNKKKFFLLGRWIGGNLPCIVDCHYDS